MTSVLFICKQGGDKCLTEYGYFRKFSGLFNSARLVNEMLNNNDISSHIEIATDNNDIDRLVTKHKPQYCIIEAYWVVPEKFQILTKLHPTVKWIVRIHSEVPFWATEGSSMDWTLRYLDNQNVYLAPNAKRLFHDIKTVLSSKYIRSFIDDRVIYLPNYYSVSKKICKMKHHKYNIVNIGCFGAIRPLKNQLIQAIAAIQYANKNNLALRFHINSNRVEGHGDPVLKNLRNLFNGSGRHRLVEHVWQPHSSFLRIVSNMDVGLQVSFTESFNIVAADMISVGIPVVTSSEIGWVSRIFHANPTDASSISRAIARSRFFGCLGVFVNKCFLSIFSDNSKKRWLGLLAR